MNIKTYSGEEHIECVDDSLYKESPIHSKDYPRNEEQVTQCE